MKYLMNELEKLNLNGRDDFYTSLICQEIPIWYKQIQITGRKISESEITYLVQRRGFNNEESTNLKRLRNFLNNNIGNIQSQMLLKAGWSKRGSLFTDPVSKKRLTLKRALLKMKVRLEQTEKILKC